MKLWGLLTIELGSAFCRQYGDAGGVVFHIWTKELCCFTEPEIVAGLLKFKNAGSTYMSLNVFRNHCKPDPVNNNMSDERAIKTLENQRLLNSEISDKSKEIGEVSLKNALNLMGSKKYKSQS